MVQRVINCGTTSEPLHTFAELLELTSVDPPQLFATMALFI